MFIAYTKKTPGVLKELLMVLGRHTLLRFKYTTQDDKIATFNTNINLIYSLGSETHPNWSPCLKLHTGAAVSPRPVHAERSRLTDERVRVVKVAQSVLQDTQPIPTAQEVTMYSWNTTDGIRICLVACLIVRLSCVLTYEVSLFGSCL